MKSCESLFNPLQISTFELLVHLYKKSVDSKGIDAFYLFMLKLITILYKYCSKLNDGNGRVARLIMNYELIKHNYPPVKINESQKLSYYSVLEEININTNYESER